MQMVNKRRGRSAVRLWLVLRRDSRVGTAIVALRVRACVCVSRSCGGREEARFLAVGG
jgi:hypothetical protein